MYTKITSKIQLKKEISFLIFVNNIILLKIKEKAIILGHPFLNGTPFPTPYGHTNSL